MHTKTIASFIIATFCWLSSFAQHSDTEEHYALLSDAAARNEHEQVVTQLDWFLQYAPGYHESVYIKGIAACKALASDMQTTDEYRSLAQKVLIAYENRIEFFGESPDLLNRRAMDAYTLLKDSAPEKAAALLLNTVEQLQAVAHPNLLTMTADLIRRSKNSASYDKQQLLDWYLLLSQVNDALCNIDASACEERTQLIAKLYPVPTLSCEELESTIGEQVASHGSDIVLAKRFVKLAMAAECYESVQLVTALEAVLASEEDYGLRRLLALIHEKNQREGDAIKNLKIAATLTDDAEKAGICYWRMGMLYFKQGDKPAARIAARQSLASNPEEKRSSKLLGDLYMSSFEECATRESEIKSRAIFVLAHQYYLQAGEAEKAQAAIEQFPTIAQLHQAGMLENPPLIKIDCWFTEEVRIKARPKGH